MTATAADIAKLRRMIAESTSATYSDDVLKAVIETYPTIDAAGNSPLLKDGTVNSAWAATYDLAAAAAHIWLEKAAALAGNFDFNADGASYQRSQAYINAVAQSRIWNARRKPGTLTLQVEPKPPADLTGEEIMYGLGSWTINL
ncbi:MAG: hypothetical protein HPY45_08285 [Anaerolineae bacterium]|nr:hypothetical protein [Anaerolineae bacterium]